MLLCSQLVVDVQILDMISGNDCPGLIPILIHNCLLQQFASSRIDYASSVLGDDLHSTHFLIPGQMNNICDEDAENLECMPGYIALSYLLLQPGMLQNILWQTLW